MQALLANKYLMTKLNTDLRWKASVIFNESTIRKATKSYQTIKDSIKKVPTLLYHEDSNEIELVVPSEERTKLEIHTDLMEQHEMKKKLKHPESYILKVKNTRPRLNSDVPIIESKNLLTNTNKFTISDILAEFRENKDEILGSAPPHHSLLSSEEKQLILADTPADSLVLQEEEA